MYVHTQLLIGNSLSLEEKIVDNYFETACNVRKLIEFLNSKQKFSNEDDNPKFTEEI